MYYLPQQNFAGMIVPLKFLQNFFKLEAAGGLLLFAAAFLAFGFENSGLSGLYKYIQTLPIAVQIGKFTIAKPLLLWVNDGLMAIFFLLVGLELKREVLDGQLSSKEQILLPMMAAIGGILAPALIYYALNADHPESVQGWAIPAATDIAFALGVLSLFGKRVPVSLKIFLTAVAIFDDLAAIIIIAVFYTNDLSTTAFVAAGVLTLLLFVLNRARVTALTPYVLLGVLLWISVLKSGVHATLAGVVLAMMIPFGKGSEDECQVKYLEHALHPWVAFLVLPLFAFVNAGVDLAGVSVDTIASPISLGVLCGLFIGKQCGAFGAAALAIKLGFARLPQGANWTSFYGIAVLSGIGFTMSLFIGTLAFQTPEALALVRLGVVIGSLASGVLAALVLYASLPGHAESEGGGS